MIKINVTEFSKSYVSKVNIYPTVRHHDSFICSFRDHKDPIRDEADISLSLRILRVIKLIDRFLVKLTRKTLTVKTV